jgi:cytoskeletal protein CcmA (bactofilin family)
MFSSKTSKPQSRIDSLIGATTRIEGNIVFSGGLRVDGMVRGNVAALPDQPGTLVVSSDARIDGEVQAAHIVVNGTINGPLHATESLELQAGSRVKGDVYYKSIEIHQGAVVEGRLVYHSAEAKGIELKLASGG